MQLTNLDARNKGAMSLRRFPLEPHNHPRHLPFFVHRVYHPRVLGEELDGIPKPKLDASMTIVAGFNFQGGILLCADTKISYAGAINLESTKIFTRTYGNGAKTAFAIVGTVTAAKMAIQECEYVLDQLEPNDLSKHKIKQTIGHIVDSIYRGHIYNHPHFGTGQAPSFELLIAAWCPPDAIALWKTEETRVNELVGYECLGAGTYLGHKLLRQKYSELRHNKISLDDAVFLAARTLSEIKGYDDACGGRSEFLVVWRDGRMSEVVPFDITQAKPTIDRASEDFQRLLSGLSA